MKLLTRSELREAKGIKFSNQWLIELERAGKFPKRRYLGALTPAWDEEEIDKWLADRPATCGRDMAAVRRGPDEAA